MSDEIRNELIEDEDDSVREAGDVVRVGDDAALRPYELADDAVRHHLRGMFRNWFLDYASYVILERAVPHINDGLKPVQRRILHSMRSLEDGRFNKVANIVGDTMKYHPHGDASIKDALVQLGQKELLIETQGNWGNTLTGADAAAARYIEARLSPFALETVYSPKVTEWTKSYDGRKDEPVTLPVKFPLLLFQGAEGIAVGLSSKILPHNLNEILDASIACLRGEEFTLYPDFPTGGFVDVSKYKDGERGGSVRIRAKIEKLDNRTIAITEIPFGKTTGTVINSIIKAFEKGKIRIRKVDDNTAESVMILVHLQPNVSSDKTIDALYAFTDCEVSVSPNCCVISDDKPHFIGVSDVLRHSAERTRDILYRELEIKLGEVRELLNFASLERIFIEERIYKDREYEQSATPADAVAHIRRRLEPFVPQLERGITDDDILRLEEIKMKRIHRYNSDEADRRIADYRDRIAQLRHDMEHITDYTVAWFEGLKAKYGHDYPRRTVIRSFDNINASSVAEVNEKLYINREEGFIGTALKKDEFVCNCSSLDDIIIFYKDGRYKVVKVAEKLSVGSDVLYVNVFRERDERTVYNVIYRNGNGGAYMMKRFKVLGITRDREYNLTPGLKGTVIKWFTANANGEAEVVKVTLRPKPRLKTLQFDVDFAEMAIKGRSAMGNIVTRNEVHRFSLKEKGVSTLGGRRVWFDPDVLRLNYEERGLYLGEFQGTDAVLVILKTGEYYMSTFDATNHYEDNILRIEKFRPGHVWCAVLHDADQGYAYLKRFTFEQSARKQRFIGDNPDSRLILLSDAPGARFEVRFGGNDAVREPMVIDAADFIAVKSFKAKGKRVSNLDVAAVVELEPRPVPEESLPEEPEEPDPDSEPDVAEPELSDEELRDEINGQERLF